MMMSHPPEYMALERELKKLCDAAHAGNALVFDHVGIIWWSAKEFVEADRRVVFDYVDSVVRSMGARLKRGGRLDRSIGDGKYWLYCKSFAATYVVGVLFDGPPPDFLVRRVVKAALPRIEALTMSLPPPTGPEGKAGVAAKPIK
jgi:hypothetical protein